MDSIGQYNGVTPTRRQTNTWSYGTSIYWRIYVSPGINELFDTLQKILSHSVQLPHKTELALTSKYIVNCDINQI